MNLFSEDCPIWSKMAYKLKMLYNALVEIRNRYEITKVGVTIGGLL